jgi:hypothetical protein
MIDGSSSFAGRPSFEIIIDGSSSFAALQGNAPLKMKIDAESGFA